MCNFVQKLFPFDWRDHLLWEKFLDFLRWVVRLCFSVRVHFYARLFYRNWCEGFHEWLERWLRKLRVESPWDQVEAPLRFRLSLCLVYGDEMAILRRKKKKKQVFDYWRQNVPEDSMKFSIPSSWTVVPGQNAVVCWNAMTYIFLSMMRLIFIIVQIFRANILFGSQKRIFSSSSKKKNFVAFQRCKNRIVCQITCKLRSSHQV